MLERFVGVTSVVVLAIGLATVAMHDDRTSTSATNTSSTTSTLAAPVAVGPPIPAAAPDVLPEGARVGSGRPPTTDGDPAGTSPPTSEVASAQPSTSSWPRLPDDGVARVVVTPTGVVTAVQRDNGDGTYDVVTPCFNSATVTGRAFSGAHVVLDPGHGGSEPGAVGQGGLLEKDVNLSVASVAIRQLEAEGAVVVVTRTADYRMSIAARAAVASALGPAAFVSIHHNADPDGPTDRPGAETYHQVASADSKRLAGLLVEEYRQSFGQLDVDWVGDTDAGAKVRLDSDGTDYYGVLSRTAGVTSVLSEAAFITNPAEERLLASTDFHQIEANALTRAVMRFVFSDDPGSGFVDPYPRDEPAGNGGGTAGCEDPPFD